MRIFGSNTRRLIQKMFMRLRLTCSIKIPWEDFEWWWSERVRNISWQSPDPLQVSGPRSSRRCEQISGSMSDGVLMCYSEMKESSRDALTRDSVQSSLFIYMWNILRLLNPGFCLTSLIHIWGPIASVSWSDSNVWGWICLFLTWSFCFYPFY